MATYSEADGYYNALDPGFGRGQEVPFWANAYLGASTSIEPLNAMKGFLGLPASGIENVELSVIDRSKFESIPKRYFEEMRRLGQMNVKGFLKEGAPSPVSVHAPILEPTGFDQQNKWNENQWKSDQLLLKDVVEKAAVMGPNTPLTIHGSHVPYEIKRYDPKEAQERLKLVKQEVKYLGGEQALENNPRLKEELDRLRRNEVVDVMYAVEPVSGQLVQLEAEKRVYPEYERLMTPEMRLYERNITTWEDQYQKQIRELQKAVEEAKLRAREAEQIGDTESASKWRRFEKSYRDDLSRVAPVIFDHVARADPEFLKKAEVRQEVERIKRLPPEAQETELANFLLKVRRRGEIPYTPKLFQSVEDFGREKASEVFANAALYSAKIGKEKFKDPAKGPVISIENVSPEMAFGSSEGMKNLIKKSREKFKERAVQELGIPKAKAEEMAKKLIGATWDIAHVNLMRRLGYDRKAILEESRKLAKDVRHVHICDNFGFSDAHMAPGAGNVPIKEFMDMLKKEGDVKGVRAIVEAGKHVATWKENPTPWTMKYFNTPVYSFQAAPTWGEHLGSYFMGTGGYSGGYGTILPPVHFSYYRGEAGAGFSAVPTALGAPLPGQEKSKFAGTPMA